MTEEQKDAAYEQGWLDSLRGFSAAGRVSLQAKRYYLAGWHKCADYRWRDPSNHGIAPDPTFRIARGK